MVVGGDVSLNRNVDISGDLVIKGNLSVYQQQNTMVINTTVNNYEVIITNDMSLNGNITASGSIRATYFNATSDYRIKDYVRSLSDCSFTIDNLRPVTYHNKLSNIPDIGLIAHEVQEHFPFLVTGEKDSEPLQSVNYTGLIGLLIHEIQQLKQRVSILEQNANQ